MEEGPMRATIYPETIDLIVAEYQRSAAARARGDAWWRADGKPFATVLDRVGMADLRGKRHPHQCRLKAEALAKGTAALHQISDELLAAPNFLEVWFLVQAAYAPIRGLGELAVYDAAERLRHRLGLESAHVIFLHAGARVGARRLAGGRLAKENAWGIQRHEVPEGLRRLSTHEVEDILCIYKDELLLSPAAFRARRSGDRGPGCRSPRETRPSC
jgi:hypothetical protein